jgi:hypothetical protein
VAMAYSAVAAPRSLFWVSGRNTFLCTVSPMAGGCELLTGAPWQEGNADKWVQPQIVHKAHNNSGVDS